MQLPTQNPVTLPFGATTDGYTPANPHRGTDFGWAGPDGYSIYAVEDCTLVYRELNGDDGNALYAQVGDHLWGYLHLAPGTALSGSVKQGQYIGRMGQSGNADGVHLHLALKVNDVYTDPYKYIKEREVTVSTIGEIEFNRLFVGFFGPITVENPVSENDRKNWIGKESNTVIRSMFEDPRQQEYASSKGDGEYEQVTVYRKIK